MENSIISNSAKLPTPVNSVSSYSSKNGSLEALSGDPGFHEEINGLVISGLCTPESNAESSDSKLDICYSNYLETLKHIGSFQNWSESDKLTFNELVENDLTEATIKLRLPDKPITSVVNKTRSTQPPWTRGEICLIAELLLDDFECSPQRYKSRFPCRSISKLHRKIQYLKNCLGKLNVDDDKLSKTDWTKSEIAKVISLIDYNLSKMTLANELPRKSIAEIKSFLSPIRISSSFTRNEALIFERLVTENHTMKTIAQEFPFKSLEEFKKKLLHIGKTHDHETIHKRLIELDVLGQIEIQNIKDSINMSQFEKLIKNDCTKSLLQLSFPAINIEQLKKIFQSQGLNEKYSTGETKYLKKALLDNASLASIVEELPFRSQISIEKNIAELDPNRRRSTFSSQIDELTYMAKWYNSDKYSCINVRNKSEDKEQKVYEHKNKIRQDQDTTKTKKRTMTNRLLEESRYFQSVTGDGGIIQEGDLRKRKSVLVIPEKVNSLKATSNIEANQKKTQKQNPNYKENQKNNQGSFPQAKGTISNSLASGDLASSAFHSSKVEDDEVSPYEPHSIANDTEIPLFRRQLYIDEIYQSMPALPNLTFTNDSNSMIQKCNDIAKTESIAGDIVSNYYKNYRDMPISFPPLTIFDRNLNKVVLNLLNKIRVRFLLYPQHSELFVLAEPKSNELDPVNEIKRLFQLHYALFFSHSRKIKKIIIQDYCNKLDDAIEENNFTQFMFVIDKWNLLMVTLCPNYSIVDSGDINEEVRFYFQSNEIKIPTEKDLNLKLFFSENQRGKKKRTYTRDPSEPRNSSFESLSSQNNGEYPSFFAASSNADKKNDPSNNCNSKSGKRISCENTLDVNDNHEFITTLRPNEYEVNFFRHLVEKKSVSRFCVQQILLRIYSRIVSIESRKLRSYKAFTAEVYGELLPSFTSEVLTKVNLRPHQKFYDLGSGVGNTTFQAALEFGAFLSGGCEIMEHASKLTELQTTLLHKHLALFGLKELPLNFALLQSFVDNDFVRQSAIDCDVLLVNNYLFDVNLNNAVGKMLYGLKPGTKIISLKNFIRPRYKACGDETIFDYLTVERHEMSNYLSVSWTANKVPYYISTVQENILMNYL